MQGRTADLEPTSGHLEKVWVEGPRAGTQVSARHNRVEHWSQRTVSMLLHLGRHLVSNLTGIGVPELT
jgi:hypothetical protein